MRSAAPRAGEIVAGRYRIISILGQSNGVLALAEHVSFDRKVAIRIVQTRGEDPVHLARIRREARALAKLESEHVARMLDVGTLPDGSLYLVRQFVEGSDLSTLVAKRGALPVAEAVGWILQASVAVAEAHASGLVHRDLSPARFFITERNPGVRGGALILKVVDFGTAKLVTGEVGEHTVTTVEGVSPYSAPEMLERGADLDPRVDVWSLGAILYELLCGRPPFGRDIVSLAIAIRREEPTALSALNPDVSADLESAVHEAIEKDRDQRTPDVLTFARAIARFAPLEARHLVDRIRELDGVRPAPAVEDDAIEISQVEVIEEIEADGSADETGKHPRFPAPTPSQITDARAPEDRDDEEEDEETRVAKPSQALGLLVPGVRPLPPAPASDDKTRTVATDRAPVRAGSLPPVPALDRHGARRPLQEKTETLGMSFVPADPRPAKRDEARGGPVFAGAAAPDAPRVPLRHPSHVSSRPQPAPAPVDLPAFRPPAELATGARREAEPRRDEPSPSSSPWVSPPAPPSLPPEDDVSLGRKMAMYAIGVGLAAILILTVVLVAMIVRGR